MTLNPKTLSRPGGWPSDDAARADRTLLTLCAQAEHGVRSGSPHQDVVAHIAVPRAHSSKGVRAKLRALRWLYGGDDGSLPTDAPVEGLLAFSILRDVTRGSVSL